MTPVQCLSTSFGLLLLLLGTSWAAATKEDQGHWGSWSSPTPCSVTCGSGVREMVRTWIYGPGEAGDKKPFTGTKTFICINEDRRDCPRNGTWTGWSAWSDCTQGCGGGTRERQRKCIGRLYGGEACPGKSEAKEKCNREPCPLLPRNFNMALCIKDKNFTCTSNKMCIPKAGRCDDNVQCHDGSDEVKCPRSRPGVGGVRYDLGGGSSFIHGFSSVLFCSAITLSMVL